MEHRPLLVGGMASVPERAEMLPEVVGRLIDQLDCLHVYLNGFRSIPSCLQHARVRAYLSHEHSGDIGDIGKFYGIRNADRYYFSLDDDFLYPCDYVRSLLSGFHRCPDADCVGFHGVLLSREVRSYRRDRSVLHWDKCLEADVAVPILGTGLMCVDLIRFPLATDQFQAPNMADLWVGLQAGQQGKRLVCLKHSKHWLCGVRTTDSLFSRLIREDRQQTKVAQKIYYAYQRHLVAAREETEACRSRVLSDQIAGGGQRCLHPAVRVSGGIVNAEVCCDCRYRQDLEPSVRRP